VAIASKWITDRIAQVSMSIQDIFKGVTRILTEPFRLAIVKIADILAGIGNINVAGVQIQMGDFASRLKAAAQDFGLATGALSYGPPAPGRAVGGPVSPGGTYRVGERGPELVTFGRAGSVTPNKAIGGGGLAINGPITINGVEDLDGLLDQLRSAAGRRNMAFGG